MASRNRKRFACRLRFRLEFGHSKTMEPFFTNPLTMAAGGALVSAPIIIHLINRMRFRRIKWAAMEFILKAQKRMKRKLIIEQLILLLLRCLLIFLVGMLLARFKWFTPLEGQESRA